MSPRNSILSYIVREGRAGGRVMRSNPASKAAHQPIVSDNHTQTHTHPHPQTTNLAQNSSPKLVQNVPKTGRQICPKHCIFPAKIDVHRREKVALGRQHRREKKLPWQPFHVLEVALLTWRLYLVAFVCPCAFLSRCVSCQNSFISPAPTTQPQKHTPGVIQSSPHTHPNHKKNKMGDVTQPSPDSYISTPPSPPGSWRRLSCSCSLARCRMCAF